MNGYTSQSVSCGAPVLLVYLKDLDSVGSVRLRTDLLEKHLSGFETMQVMVFTTDTVSRDATVHSRFFAPALGIYEDPATGAASGPLGCYLVRYGIVGPGEQMHIVSEQGYELGRRSRIIIGINCDGEEISGVAVGGQSVMAGKGLLLLDTEK
jgi:trans-2,3-dihydro-3-hydroxyanthranilate isomerase